MDGAASAAASDPALNRQFSRRWTGPPQKRERRPWDRTANSGNHNNNAAVSATAAAAVQRALIVAARRAAQLDRTADLLLALGRHSQAERLSHRALELRELVLA